jgi:hypothetical protein
MQLNKTDLKLPFILIHVLVQSIPDLSRAHQEVAVKAAHTLVKRRL